MVRVLRAKIEPQSGSKLSHTHAPEPARSCDHDSDMQLPWIAMDARRARLACCQENALYQANDVFSLGDSAMG